MQSIKAIKPRTFDVTYECADCGAHYVYDVQINLPPETEHNEIDCELSMFRPFACEECGDDSFLVINFAERS